MKTMAETASVREGHCTLRQLNTNVKVTVIIKECDPSSGSWRENITIQVLVSDAAIRKKIAGADNDECEETISSKKGMIWRNMRITAKDWIQKQRCIIATINTVVYQEKIALSTTNKHCENNQKTKDDTLPPLKKKPCHPRGWQRQHDKPRNMRCLSGRYRPQPIRNNTRALHPFSFLFTA